MWTLLGQQGEEADLVPVAPPMEGNLSLLRLEKNGKNSSEVDTIFNHPPTNMMENNKNKELYSQCKANGATLKGKPYWTKDSAVGSAPTGKNSYKFAGPSKESDAYQTTAPASQLRNARFATVSECCSGAPEETVCHRQLCGGSSLTLRSARDSVAPILSESISFDETKYIRRQQYITNKRVKRSLKNKNINNKNKNINNKKIYKEHKNKRDVNIHNLSKALVALPSEEGIELAAIKFVCQSRCLEALVAPPESSGVELAAKKYVSQARLFKPDSLPVWLKYVRPDSIVNGFDLFWFHLEKLVSVISLLKNCDTLIEMLHILNLYLGIYFDGSIVEGFLSMFETCTERLMTCQSTGLNVFKSLLTNWQAIKESEAAKQLYHFISTVLATGLCKVNHIELSLKGLEVFRIAATKKVASLTDLVQVVIETTVFFYERGCAYLSTNNLWDLIYSDNQIVIFEKEFAFVVANKPYAIAGEWTEMEMSSLDYFALMDKLTDDIVGMIKLSTGPEKSNLSAKLTMLEKVKVEVKRANVAPTMRMKPFGVVLFGGTGVGKSSVLPYIIHYLNKINGFESSRERVITLNPAEKYQSEYKCNTNVVILDDIMNQKLEVSDGSPGDLIIRLLNNIPAAALKADVDSKGNVMMAPNFVYGTTNVKTMCSHQLSNEPVSILRRFEYFITMTVKDEYSRSDSVMLDSSKVPRERVPDAWWFKVEYVVPEVVHDGHPAKPKFHVARDGDRPLDKIGIQHLLDFLGHSSKIHFAEQRDFVSRSADVFRMEICDRCKQLENLCNCARNEVEDQADSTAWPSAILRHIEEDEESESSIFNFDYVNATDEQVDAGVRADDAWIASVREDEDYHRRNPRMRHQGFTEFFGDAFDRDRIRRASERKSYRDMYGMDIGRRSTPAVSSDEEEMKPQLSENNIRLAFDQLFLGNNLPTKTRFEHIRDKAVSEVVKNPFLQSFITGQYNSMLGWTAVCWNFLVSKWKDDKWDCMLFMMLLMINSAVITAVTVPVAIATRCGIFSARRIDQCYSWATDRMTKLILSESSLVKMRENRIRQVKTVMKLSLYGVSLLSMVYVIKRAINAYKVYSNQALSEGGTLPIDEKHKIDHWAPVVISTVPPSLKSSTTTADQLRNLLEKKIGSATLRCVETKRKSQMVIFPLCSNIWVINSHALTGHNQEVDVVIREPGTIGPNFSDIIGVNNTYIIPDNDLALVVLPRGGSQYDFTEYFPEIKEHVKYMCSIVYKGPDSIVKDQRVLAYPKTITYQGPKGNIVIKGYHYTANEPTFEGMCMSPLMTYESKPQILGFHCCGVTGAREGGAAMLCRQEIIKAIGTLKGRLGLMVAHSACPNGLNFEDIGPFPNVSLIGDINAKSPFRFLEQGTFNLYGQHSGPRQTPSTAVVKTLLSDAVEEIFGVPCQWGPPENIKTYKPRRVEAVKMCAISSMDPDRMAYATYDYCLSVFDALPDAAVRGIQPLDRATTLSGQDGISQLRSVVLSTSCGHPINKPKNKVLRRTGVSTDFVTDIIEAPDYIWERVEKCEKLLLEGKRCHFVFKASLKDEPKKIGSGKVRVFAGVSLEGLLIMRKYFLPLGIVIMRNPYLCESAVGINAHGKDWDRLVRHVTKRGSDRMIAGDYAGFDSSMSPSASMAAFSCLLYLACRCGYSQDDLAVMRGIATEICYPTYDFFGEIVVVAGSEPSGHPMTVFVNNIVNSLYIRYAYYSIYSFDRERFFNSVVTQMNYGDDNIMSVSEDRKEFNHTAIQKELEKSGVIYTMADKEGVSIPFIKMEDCAFLKRTFRHDVDRDVYLGPLDVMSLYKTLHTCVKSDTVTLELQNCDMVSSVLFEAFLHGRDFYEDFREKMIKVLEKCSVVHWFPHGVPSFESQQEVWDKRYSCEDSEQYENPHGSGVVGDSYIFE